MDILSTIGVQCVQSQTSWPEAMKFKQGKRMRTQYSMRFSPPKYTIDILEAFGVGRSTDGLSEDRQGASYGHAVCELRAIHEPRAIVDMLSFRVRNSNPEQNANLALPQSRASARSFPFGRTDYESQPRCWSCRYRPEECLVNPRKLARTAATSIE